MNRNLSLTQLEGADWGPPTYESHVVTECHRLRHVPLGQLRPEDLRLLVGQEVSLPFVVPLALEILNAEPLIECDLFPGDLFESFCHIPASFWSLNPNLLISWQNIQTKAGYPCA